MDIDEPGRDVGERRRYAVGQLYPEKIDGHDEATLVGFDRDRNDAFEIVKDIAERRMKAGIVAKRTHSSVYAGEPSVNSDRAPPTVTRGEGTAVLGNRVRREGSRGCRRGRLWRGCGSVRDRRGPRPPPPPA